MSLRERSHAAYLQPVAEERVDDPVDVVEKARAENDNDRPRSAFENTLAQITSEYQEAAAAWTETTGHLQVFEQDLTVLRQEIEAAGPWTAESAALTAEYAEIFQEYQTLLAKKEKLTKQIDTLRIEYQPFEAVQEAIPHMHTATAEAQALRDQEQTLQADAIALRAEWAKHEVDAEADSARITAADEFTAGTQRALLANIESAQKQCEAYKQDPRTAHDPNYLAYFKQVDDWIAAQQPELATLTDKRQALYDEWTALKSTGKNILARYDACMEAQLNTVQQIAIAEAAWETANAQHQQGIVGAGESIRTRGALSTDEPEWVAQKAA